MVGVEERGCVDFNLVGQRFCRTLHIPKGSPTLASRKRCDLENVKTLRFLFPHPKKSLRLFCDSLQQKLAILHFAI